jgi:hypothetical protein
MGSLVFEVNQKFKTKGIWASKKRKNILLNHQDAALKVQECGDDIKLQFQHIDIEDGMSRMSFYVGKDGIAPGGIMKMEYDVELDSFEIEVKGTLSLKIEDPFMEQFVREGDKLKFILMGVIAKEGPYFGGYMSRYEKYDHDINNYHDCPSVITSLKN